MRSQDRGGNSLDARYSAAGETTIIVPAGVLGAGLRPEHINPAIDAGAHAIAIDAGSTDSGPAYLARAMAKFNREAVRTDLDLLMIAAARARIPLLVGSCGTCGCDSSVHDVSAIVQDIARARGLKPRIALLLSEQAPQQLKEYNGAGRVTPLPPAGPLADDTIEACDHIVALMGTEPFAAALRQGADIVLGGRTTDTAIIAAVPLMRGAGAGPAWHAGKVAECGGLAAVNPRDGGVLVRVGRDAFTMEPLSAVNQCTASSVSAHMLYENSNPFHLTEPGGVLDVEAAEYHQLDARTVRVTGSRFETRPYTMKLEGAGSGPFQTIMLIGIQDPAVLAELDAFHDRMLDHLRQRVASTFGNEAEGCDISLRVYGWNAVSGLPVPAGAAPPREVGVLFVATAPTQSLATRVTKACNTMFFHFPLKPGIPLPSYAFPFTPAEIERGQVFEFKLNHVVALDDPLELVRTEWVDLSVGNKAVQYA